MPPVYVVEEAFPQFLSMKHFSFSSLATLVVALTLVACNSGSDLQTRGDAYIRSNISTLSPRRADPGTQFSISGIEWEDEDSAIVTYGDGQRILRGRTDVTLSGNAATATRFRLLNEDGGSMMDSSVSASASAGLNSSRSSASSASSKNAPAAAGVNLSVGANASAMSSSRSSQMSAGAQTSTGMNASTASSN